MKISEISSERWPVADLEVLGHCPVCGSKDRAPLHGPMTDRLFHCAPGEWQLHTCRNCELGYLDPRPTVQSIGRAYVNYFTHGDEGMAPAVSERFPALRTRLRKAVRSVFNGFRNHRWGTRLEPSSSWGGALVGALPPVRSLVLAHMRHLPPRPPYAGAQLLDVGCGDGAFLQSAQAAGWQVSGVDFDAKALAVARHRGVQVFCGDLSALGDKAGCFEYITCSHVIEHVHNPAQWLEQMRTLLAPQGTLWLQTPNLASAGHRYFGVDWRALDAPRHLCLFTPPGLNSLMRDVGFQCHFVKLPFFMAIPEYLLSYQLQRDHYSGLGRLFSVLATPVLVMMAILQSLFKEQSEFMTVVARHATESDRKS